MFWLLPNVQVLVLLRFINLPLTSGIPSVTYAKTIEEFGAPPGPGRSCEERTSKPHAIEN